MAKIIVKSSYYKPNSERSAAGFIRYISTRDGVEKIDESKKYLPAAKKTQQIISRLLSENPQLAQLPLYLAYQNHPTRENADNLLLHLAEENAEYLGSREDYVSYIAQRPNVEFVDENHSHGLFTDNGVPIVMSHVMGEVAVHQGNIWTHIISLQREDAERLGYDSAEAWMNLLRSKRNAIARSMKIAPENFRWYAAFHKEAAHPHVHMVVYSVNPREGYLTQTGIEQIKSVLAREIFRMDMLDVYRQQSAYRDELRRKVRELVEHLVRQVQSGGGNPKLNELLLQLSDRLSHTEGKKVYAYLTPELKNLVDEIVDELAKDKRIANLYDLWYEQKKEIAAIYTDDPPEKVPLSENDDFRPIKNAVIKEAYNLYLTSVTKLRTRDRSGYAAISALNLLKYLSQMLRDRYYDEQDDLDVMVDSKLRAEINEKKRAQGLKS
jgi:hypothetical protein